MTRPSVNTKCVADKYHAPGERIVEFLFPSGRGGLISFRPCSGDGSADCIDIYRVDDGVLVFQVPAACLSPVTKGGAS